MELEIAAHILKTVFFLSTVKSIWLWLSDKRKDNEVVVRYCYGIDVLEVKVIYEGTRGDSPTGGVP